MVKISFEIDESGAVGLGLDDFFNEGGAGGREVCYDGGLQDDTGGSTSIAPCILEQRICPACMGTCEFVENDELCPVCVLCGFIDRSGRSFDDRTPFEDPEPIALSVLSKLATRRPRSSGRYKEKFHLSERLSQWMCTDPEIPPSAWSRIQDAADSGKYGPKTDFTRATIIQLTKDLRLQKYRERWRRILTTINPDTAWTPEEEPDPAFSDFIHEIFPEIVRAFFKYKDNHMPGSVTRKPGHRAIKKPRHNFISYNYLIRKVLEFFEDWSHHEEFPLPRSDKKLHALDDIMEVICMEMGGFYWSSFERSAVIKRPKY